jgi:hypothetical protein
LFGRFTFELELYIKLPVFPFASLEQFVHSIFSLPVAGSNPNTYNNMATITDIKIKGTNTIIHDIIPIPDWHRAFKSIVITIITIALKNAVLYSPLKVSIIIWVNENAIYINAGAHKFSIYFIILYEEKKQKILFNEK